MPRPYTGATCRGSIVLGTGCGTCERCKDEIAKYALKPELSDMDKATIRGAIIMAQRQPHLAVSAVVSELVKIIQRTFCFPIYCYDEKWCRSLNGAKRCSDCPCGSGQPSIVERIALDETLRGGGPPERQPVNETDPPISIGWPTPPNNENERLRAGLHKIASAYPCSTAADMARVAADALGLTETTKSGAAR